MSLLTVVDERLLKLGQLLSSLSSAFSWQTLGNSQLIAQMSESLEPSRIGKFQAVFWNKVLS